MGIPFHFKRSLSPGVYIQAQVGLKGIKGSKPFHFVSSKDISASSEGLDPTAFFVFGKEIMAEALYVQIGCGSGSTSWPLTDQTVYF